MKILLWGMLAAASLAAQASVNSFFPEGDAVPLNARVLARYCCGQGRVEVRGPQGIVPGESRQNGQAVLFVPAAPWAPRTSYAATVIVENVRVATFNFVTGTQPESAAFRVVGSVPADGEDGALLSSRVRVRFSHAVNPLTLTTLPKLLVDGRDSFSPSWNWLSNTELMRGFPFSPQDLLAIGSYELSFEDPNLEDLFGRKLGPTGFRARFNTHPGAPAGGARVLRSLPGAGETGVPTNSSFYLEFENPVQYAEGMFTLVSPGEAAPIALEPVNLSFGGPTRAIALRPRLLLRGNQEYALRAQGLLDIFGRGPASPELLRFRSGTLPEARTPALVAQPSAIQPLTNRLEWRFNMPVDPHRLPLFARVDVTPNVLIPLRVQADGLGAEADIPGLGTYYLAGSFLDRVLFRQMPNLTSRFNVSAGADREAPTVRALFPENEATAAPNTAITVLFDEPVRRVTGDQLRLTLGDQPIAVEAVSSFDSTSQTFRSREPLEPGATYRAELSGVRDVAGNAAARIVWSFTVQTPSTEPFRLLATDPAANATNLPARQRFVATFNRPPSLLSVLNFFSDRIAVREGAVPGMWMVEGNRLIFEPSVDIPAGRVTWNLSNLQDQSGQNLTTNAFVSGWIGGGHADAGPSPRVAGMTPEANAALAEGDAIQVDFDLPLDRGSISTSSVRMDVDGQPQSFAWTYDPVRRRLTLQLPDAIRLTSRALNLSVSLTRELRGFNGGAVEPFSRSFTVRPGIFVIQIPSTERSFVARDPFREGLEPNRAIVVYFTEAMDTALVERHLQVAVGETRIAGRFEWTPDQRAFTFYPAAPLPVGEGYMMLPKFPWGLNGNELFRFRVAASAADSPISLGPALSVPGSLSNFASWPLDAQLEVRFNTDRTAAYIQSVVAISGRSPAVSTPVNVEVRTPRRFVLRPATPLATGFYTLEIRLQGVAEPFRAGLNLSGQSTPVSREAQYGPTLAMGEVPLNAPVWVKARTLLNAASIEGTLVTAGGEAKPVNLQVRGASVLLVPNGLLRPATTYTVRISAWEDMAGRAMPPLTWSFRTGVALDLTPPRLLSLTPRGPAHPDVIPVAVFDRPMAILLNPSLSSVDNADDFTTSTSVVVAGQQKLSADGRTISLIPNRPWAANVTYGEFSLSPLNGLTSWTGQPPLDPSPRPTFTIDAAAGSSTEAPRVTQVSPPPESAAIPLNARFRVRFAQEVMADSLERFRVETDGQAIAIRREVSANGRVVNLVPMAPLLPETVYTVVAEGARGLAGQAQERAETWNVRTSTTAFGNRGALVTLASIGTNGLEVVIRAARPIDPVEFAPERFQLVARFPLATNAVLSADGLSIRLTPREPTAAVAGVQIVFPEILDYAGAPMSLFGLSSSPLGNSWGFDLGAEPPPPAQLQSVVPPDGSNVAPFPLVGAIYNRAPFVSANARATVTNRGRALPVRLNVVESVAFVEPGFTFLPGETYAVEIDGLVDSLGEALPGLRWSFSVRPDGVLEQTLRLVSSTPALNATNVAPEGTVVFEFNQVVLPSGSFTPASFFAAGRSVPAVLTYRGNRVEARAATALPGGQAVSLNVRVRSLHGQEGFTGVSFTTAPLRDTTPPELESIFPPPGTRLFAGENSFSLRFSEPVEVPPASITWSPGGATSSPQSSTADGRTLAVRFGVNPGLESATLNLLDSITDLAGNRLRAQTLGYSSYSEAESARPRFVSATPVRGSGAVPRDAAVTLVFSHAMNESSLNAGVTVLENGTPRAFQLSSENEDKTWRVTPLSPWAPGALVSVTLASTLYTRDGVLIFFESSFSNGTQFNVAGGGSTPELSAILSTKTYVDLRFSAVVDAPPGAALRAGDRPVAARVERMGPSWWRVVPSEAVTPDTRLELTVGEQTKELPLRLTAAPAELRETPWDVRKAAPGEYVITFARPVHPFALDSAITLLDGQGEALPYEAWPGEGGVRVLVRVLSATQPVRLRLGERVVALR